MQDIGTTSGYFLHLLGAGLRTENPLPVPEGVDVARVYALAKLHKVDDVAFAAISRLENKPACFDAWYKRHCMAIARSATQIYEYGLICRALTDAGARILPYKGILLKAYYPEASMRFMSDIDMLYLAPENDHARVKAAMESLGYTTEQFDTGVHDTYHKPPVMSVELHRVIFSKDAEGYLSNADYMAAAAQDANGVLILPVPYLYFATLTHAVKHLRTDAIDLRCVIDLYLLRRSMDEVQNAQADALIKGADLSKADQALCKVARAVFDGQEPDAHTKACLAHLLASPQSRQSADANYLRTYQKGGSVKAAKLRYFCHLVLPGYTYMKKNYPILAKAPILLPLWWPVRWVDVLLFGRKRAKAALHRFDGMDKAALDRQSTALSLFGLK